MKIDDDDFTLFGVAQTFALDRALLDAAYRQLQSRVHPDRFASEGAAAQRLAMQWAVRVNEAYQRLKDPLKRAAYLCQLRGVAIGSEDNTAMPAAFLMQQMAWREALDDAHDEAAVQALADEVQAEQGLLFDALRVALDQTADFSGAAAKVRALMFMARFTQDLERRFDALES